LAFVGIRSWMDEELKYLSAHPKIGVHTAREVLELLRGVFARLPVRALDIVEVSPPHDYADITAFAAAKVIYEAFGWVKAKANRNP